MELDKCESKEIKLYKAFLKARGEISAIETSGKNPRFNSSYATLGDILKAVQPPLIKNGLILTQPLEYVNEGLQLQTSIIHEEGGRFEKYVIINTAPPEYYEKNIQNIGSLITYWRRYTLVSLLGVSGGMIDDDGEACVSNRDKESLKKVYNFKQATKKPEGLSVKQLEELSSLLTDHQDIQEMALKGLNIKKLKDVPASKFESVLGRIKELIQSKKARKAAKNVEGAKSA